MIFKYDVVFEDKYFIKIRLEYGIIINIFKIEFDKSILENDFIKKYCKKKNEYIYELKKEYENNNTRKYYPIGTKVFKLDKYNFGIITKIYENKKDWYWELKTTGNYFSGKTEHFESLVKTVEFIINKY